MISTCLHDYNRDNSKIGDRTRESSGNLNKNMRAVAIKKSSGEKTMGFQEMGTFRCDGCAEEFFISQDPKLVDKRLAEKQAKWLEKVLAEELERDKKHSDRIELPG